MNKTCGFISSHSNLALNDTKIKRLIREAIEKLIVQDHVTQFISGINLGADLLCADVVLELKANYPRISLEYLPPFGLRNPSGGFIMILIRL